MASCDESVSEHNARRVAAREILSSVDMVKAGVVSLDDARAEIDRHLGDMVLDGYIDVYTAVVDWTNDVVVVSAYRDYDGTNPWRFDVNFTI